MDEAYRAPGSFHDETVTGQSARADADVLLTVALYRTSIAATTEEVEPAAERIGARLATA